MTESTQGLNYVKTTKKQLWDMVKELEAERSGSNGTATTTEVEKQARLDDAFSTLKTLNIENLEAGLDSVVSTLRAEKKVLEDLDLAIKEKQLQLKNVHDFEAAANSAVLMIEAKEKLAKEIDEKNRELLEATKEEANNILHEANEEARLLKEEAHEKSVAAEKIRTRQKEEWLYEFERQKKTKWDEFQDQVEAKLKDVKAREEEVAEREAEADEKDEKIAALERSIVELEADINNKVRMAEGKAKALAEREAKHAQELFEAQLKNELKGLETDKAHLTAQLMSARDRINELEKQLSNANERITTIATGALKAGADAATVTEVAKTVAAGASGKGR